MTMQLLTLLGIGSPIFVLAFIVMWWLLKKSIDAKIDILKTKEIDVFKGNLTKELETTKYELKLEHTKLSIVYENQRDSFKSLIQGMYEAIENLKQPFDDLWTAIPSKYYDEFCQLVAKEDLFISRRNPMNLELDDLDKVAAKAFEGVVVRKDLIRRFKGQYPVPTMSPNFCWGAIAPPWMKRRSRKG